jgi:hypothetical protein
MARSFALLAVCSFVSLAAAAASSSCGTPNRRELAFDRPAGRECHGPIDITSPADVGLLTGCVSIDGDLRIHSETLETLVGFERLVAVRYVVISDNPALTSIAGLSGLRSVQGVTLNANPRLTSLVGLSNVRSLEGLVLIGNGIRSLEGLDNLISAGDLVISGNPALANLAGAPRLSAVENLDIEHNPAVSGIGALANIEIGGSAWTDFSRNDSTMAAR